MIFHGEKLEHHDKPLHELLLERFDIHYKADPDSIAFITAENEKDSVTFGQLYKNIIQISEWFVENGYKKGDVILLACYNNWRFFAAALGAWRAGVTVSAASSQFTSYEMRYQIEDSQSKMIIVDTKTLSTVLEACKDLSYIKNIVSISPNPPSPVIQFDSLTARLIRNLKMPSIDPANDLVFLPYSSGTTGKPKGVMITHLNFTMMTVSCIKFFDALHKSMGLPEDFVIPYDLHFLPMYHAMGLFRTILTSYRGTTQILFTKFDMELMLKLIEQYAIAVLSMVPAIAVRLVNSTNLLKKYDISSLTTISVGSAPLPEGAVQKLKQIIPDLKIVQGYGMTELTFATHLQGADSPAGSVGKPIPGTSMKVKKEDGTLCGPHEIGELWIKGPQMMKGYWKKENLFEELVDEDGFMRTGDIVYFDKDGETFICDRIKELIKVNAKQVAPAELESVALEHDDVADVCVFGVDDASSGERPVACVVPRGKKDLDTMKAIMKHVNQKLARYKHIKEIQFVTEILRTGTGKILRRTMKKAYLDAKKSRL